MKLTSQLHGDLVHMQPLVVERGFRGVGDGNVQVYGIICWHDDLLGRAGLGGLSPLAGGR